MFQKEKRCESCGATFECSGLWFCWCRHVKVDDETRRDLRARFTDCLCPRCLERAAQAGGMGVRFEKPSVP